MTNHVCNVPGGDPVHSGLQPGALALHVSGFLRLRGRLPAFPVRPNPLAPSMLQFTKADRTACGECLAWMRQSPTHASPILWKHRRRPRACHGAGGTPRRGRGQVCRHVPSAVCACPRSASSSRVGGGCAGGTGCSTGPVCGSGAGRVPGHGGRNELFMLCGAAPASISLPQRGSKSQAGQREGRGKCPAGSMPAGREPRKWASSPPQCG